MFANVRTDERTRSRAGLATGAWGPSGNAWVNCRPSRKCSANFRDFGVRSSDLTPAFLVASRNAVVRSETLNPKARYFVASSVTSNTSVAFGGITPPAPRAP